DGKININDIEQLTKIINELPQDNTVIIYTMSVDYSFSKMAEKKGETLPNYVLFTDIKQINCIIERYFINKQDLIKDNIHNIMNRIEEIDNKFDKFEAQGSKNEYIRSNVKKITDLEIK
ncbi:6634_t:CDS:2, partial [Dentiscutata erythropus]